MEAVPWRENFLSKVVSMRCCEGKEKSLVPEAWILSSALPLADFVTLGKSPPLSVSESPLDLTLLTSLFVVLLLPHIWES